MAGYRQFHTQFWKDEWLIELDPLERYLFSYLFTNELSSISGIYKLPMRVIQNETGLDRDFIEAALKKFQDAEKIFYKDGVMWVVNMRKYHKNASPRTMTKVNKDVRDIPDCDVKKSYLYYEKTGIYHTDTVSIPRSEIVSESESVNKSESESESESERDGHNGRLSGVDYDFGALCNVYEKNFGPLTPALSDLLQDDLDEYGLQMCLDAMTEALRNNVRKWSYVQGILKRRHREGVGAPGRVDKPPGDSVYFFDVGSERQFYQAGKLIRTEPIPEAA
jgi:DnaD/phage-associated family protein